VGGEITYRCLGGNLYELSVTVFRDCDTGVPWFDNPASVGVFDNNNSLVYDLRLTLRNNDTLDLDLTDPCFVAPPNVCIHTTTYRDTVSLPFRPGGYQVVYQRCCRNQDIVNIVNPLSSGATYSVTISEAALTACNSSPVFRDWPPVYICAGVPIIFDHSATDADGDSIVYELCTPFDGATTTNPMPQPPFNPPYTPVTWLPPYNQSNMLGGTAPLNINNQSGLLTGTPTTLGVFVVGVCAREYRNGVLLSEVRRDFQYAVGICGRRVSAAFFAPEVQCDNSLTVRFNNSSQSLGTGYVWSFGDPSNPNTSTLANPVHVYPDTGRYTVTLIADPGSQCADTTTRQIYLQYESLISGFSVNALNCTDSLVLAVTDLSTDSISSITRWHWDFGNGDTANVPFPTIIYDSSGTYIVRLQVTSANGCTASFSDTLSFSLPQILSNDTVAICDRSQGVVLNPGGNTSHQYQWSPATGLSSTTAASPLANPNQTTLYRVTVTAFNGIDTCILERSILVVVPPPVTVQLPPDSLTCRDTIQLLGQGSNVQTWAWSFNSNFTPIVSNGNPARLPLITGLNRWIYLRGTDAFGCSAVDSMRVLSQNIPIAAAFTFSPLSCDTVYRVAFVDQSVDTSQGPIVAWSWSLGNGASSTLQNPIGIYQQSGTYPIRLQIRSANGCTGTAVDTLRNLRLPLLVGRTLAGICQGQSSVQLNVGGDPNLLYQWSPGTGLSSTTAASPIASPGSATVYTVTISAVNGIDTCRAVHRVSVTFPAPITVSLPPVVTYCGSTVTLQASSSTAVAYAWSRNPLFSTIIGTTNPVTVTPLNTPQDIFYVRATDAAGCTATASTTVQQSSLPVNVQFGFQSDGCADTMRMQFFDLTTDTLGSSIVAWQWFSSDGQISNLRNPVFIYRNSGFYFVTLTVRLANGCTGTLSQNFNLNLATLTRRGTQSLCGGSSVVLNPGGNPNLQYQWGPSTGLSSITATSPTATPPSLPFSYVVTITGFNSMDTCVSIQNLSIIQSNPPSLSLAEDTTVCNPNYTISATTSNNIQRLEWALDRDYNLIAVVNFNPVFLNFTPGLPETFTIYARVFDNVGCEARDSGIIRYDTASVPVNFSYTIPYCADSLLIQYQDLSGIAPARVQAWQWTFDGGQQTSSAQNPSIRYNNFLNPRTAQLRLLLRNGCQGLAQQSINYRFAALSELDSIGLCDGQPRVLNSGGDPSLQYQWSPAAGLSATNIASPLASPTVTTAYTVTITAFNPSDTCIKIDTVVVGVGGLELNLMADTLLCGSNQILLRANPNRSLRNITWALDRQFQLVLGNTNPLLTNANISRWYYVRAKDAFGCEAVDSVRVDVQRQGIQANFSMDLLDCLSDLRIQFRETSTDTVGNPIVAWQWDLGNGQTANTPNPLGLYGVGGSYLVRLTVLGQNGCSGSISRPLSLELPTITNLNDTLIACGGATVALNPSGGISGRFSWSPSTGLDNPNSPNPRATVSNNTLYTLRVWAINNLGGQADTCERMEQVLVLVPPATTARIQGQSAQCQSLANLSVQGNALGYRWSNSRNFNPILGTDSLLQLSFVDGEWLYVQGLDAFGCGSLDSIQVFNRSANIRADSLVLACLGETANLRAQNLVLGDSLRFDWSPSGLILSGQGSPLVLVDASANADFLVVGSNQYGCTDTAVALLRVGGTVPVVQLQASPNVVNPGQSSQLQATFNADYRYQWQPANSLSNASLHNPLATPPQTLFYTLTVTDRFGCQFLDSIQVQVKSALCAEPNIFVPNVFSPNGDGQNDVLFVRGNGITELYFAVYNRWGEKMFETNDQSQGWDGRFQGVQLGPDAYGYYLECRCGDGNKFFKKGNVTIVR
jgi:gliding motility-associated-like protein